MVVTVFFPQKIQVKTSVADLIVRKPQSDRFGSFGFGVGVSVKRSQFLSFEITLMDWMMRFEVEHMALASEQLVSQRDTVAVSIFQAVVFLG